MKSPRTILNAQRKLRRICEDSKDPIEARMAQIMETCLTWATNDMRGWGKIYDEPKLMASILRGDLERIEPL